MNQDVKRDHLIRLSRFILSKEKPDKVGRVDYRLRVRLRNLRLRFLTIAK